MAACWANWYAWRIQLPLCNKKKQDYINVYVLNIQYILHIKYYVHNIKVYPLNDDEE